MKLLVHRVVEFGERVVLVGSTDRLGRWKVPAGQYCTWHEGHIWKAEIPPAPYPTRFEFKYCVVSNTGEQSWEDGPNHAINLPEAAPSTLTLTWGNGYEHVLHPSILSDATPSPPPTPSLSRPPVLSLAQAAVSLANGASSEQVTFRIKYALQSGERMYIVGSIPELGAWNKMNSPLMRASNKRDFYEFSFRLPRDEAHEQFEYKYFTRRQDGSRRWEGGENRIARPFEKDAPRDAPEDGNLLWDDRWEKIRFDFSIYYPTKESQVMNVTGDPPEIGAWYQPGPTPMHLGPMQMLETDVEGRKWFLSVWTNPDQKPFSYRYIVVDSVSKQELWEREPNRQAQFDEKTVVNSVHTLRDLNFVSEMHFDRVPPNMFIGPYPQTAADVDAMAKGGVTAVFNVQTDEDFKHRAIQWKLLMDRYKKHDIKVVRYPIRDFDRDSLRARLHGATHALDDLLQTGRQVYIHCTAGMGRAPACAVSYLCWVEKMALVDAVAYVKKYRKVAVPNVPVLEQALQEPY